MPFFLISLLGDPTHSAAASFTPLIPASLDTRIPYLGLVSPGSLAWVAQVTASIYLGEFILTDQRVGCAGPHKPEIKVTRCWKT